MSLTITTTTAHPVSSFTTYSPTTEFKNYILYDRRSPQNVSDSTLLSPEAWVDIALQSLSLVGVKLIEWRSMLYRRMNVPIMTKNFSYVVPESSMALASSTLSNLGLPLSTAEPFLINAEGELYSKAVLHRLTKSTDRGAVRYIALYPSSFISFSESDLEFTKSCTHEGFTGIKLAPVDIFVPRPPAVYATLLRLLATAESPRRSATRSILKSDLALLIRYHLYRESLACPYDEDEDAEDWDVVEAVTQVREWSIEGQWREGEEWMGDALAAVVGGTGSIDWLP